MTDRELNQRIAIDLDDSCDESEFDKDSEFSGAPAR